MSGDWYSISALVRHFREVDGIQEHDMKSVWFGVMVVWLASHTAVFGYNKIAYVDLQLALNSVDEGKKAKALIGSDYEKKKKKLMEKQQELQFLKDLISNSDGILSESARAEKEEEYKKKFVEFQKLLAESQQDIQKKEATYTNTILADLRDIVEELGQKGKYLAILEKSAVVFAPNSIDITQEVITEYNSRKNGKKDSAK